MILFLFKILCLLEPFLFKFFVQIVQQVKIWTINLFCADSYCYAIFQWIFHNPFYPFNPCS